METAERADGTLAREIAAPGEKAADAREKTDIICALGRESRAEEFRQGSQANELGGNSWIVKAQLHSVQEEKRVELNYVEVIAKFLNFVTSYSEIT